MEEKPPGIFEASPEEIAQMTLGNMRVVDYVSTNMPVPLTGPNDLVRELVLHPESKLRSIAVGIIHSNWNALEKVFWLTGIHGLPKEEIEIAAMHKGVAVTFFNHDIPEEGLSMNLDIAQQVVDLMIPKDIVNYSIADLISVENNMVKSLMCDGSCCPPQGVSLGEITNDKETKEETSQETS